MAASQRVDAHSGEAISDVRHSALEPGCGAQALRHTTAVHLLGSGVEVNVIRAWLGDVSLDTTHRYAEITVQMKAQALDACEPPVSAGAGHLRRCIWRDDESMLQWQRCL